MPGRAIAGPVDFDLRLGDHRIFGSSYMRRLTHFDEPVIATTVFLYHELFHFFQTTAFAPIEYDETGLFDELASFDPGSETDQEQQRAGERSRLAAALTAGSDSATAFHLRAYYRQLDRRMPRRLRIGEEYAERVEGTATLISYESAIVALDMSAHDPMQLVLRDLAQVFPEERDNGWDGLRTWHMYAAGAAKALLIAKLGDEPLELVGFANDDGAFQPGYQRTLGSSGLRLDAAYGLKNFALVVLSASYLSRSLNVGGFVEHRLVAGGRSVLAVAR